MTVIYGCPKSSALSPRLIPRATPRWIGQSLILDSFVVVPSKLERRTCFLIPLSFWVHDLVINSWKSVSFKGLQSQSIYILPTFQWNANVTHFGEREHRPFQWPCVSLVPGELCKYGSDSSGKCSILPLKQTNNPTSSKPWEVAEDKNTSLTRIMRLKETSQPYKNMIFIAHH